MKMDPFYKKLIAVGAVMLCAYFGLIGVLLLQEGGNTSTDYTPQNLQNTSTMKQFSSYEEMQGFLAQQALLSSGAGTGNLTAPSEYYGYDDDMAMDESVGDDDDSGDNAPSNGGSGKEYSTTNVQEMGVDEGDILKNDGAYCYVVSGDRTEVVVSRVYPASNCKILSEIKLEGSIQELYLLGDRLCVLGTYGGYDYGYGYVRGGYSGATPAIFVNVYDVSDPASPQLFRNDTMLGSYVSSRMVGEYFYLISNRYSNQVRSEQDLPTPASQIYYQDQYDVGYTFTSIMAINVKEKNLDPAVQVMLIGSSGTIYASVKNIYLTNLKYLSWAERKEIEIERVIMPMLPYTEQGEVNRTMSSGLPLTEKLKQVDAILGAYLDGLTESERGDFETEWRNKLYTLNNELEQADEKTSINRIAINNDKVTFEATGEVPGHILNKYSMSEYNHHFRIATTTGEVWREGKGSAMNHLFILDMELKETGSVRDIAPGERIYSVRFMGDRAYMVTFMKVDPFFVIDVKDPAAPKILGELKIPGYSDYLHPFDENHVIGLGKDTVLSSSGSFSWYQGVKISLFDVTDLENPIEDAKYVIGDRGTESLAQYDPHAFLFSLSKNLLVLPISLYERPGSAGSSGGEDNQYGEYVGEFAYVLDISDKDGIVLEGRISHSEGGASETDRWDDGWKYEIQRSFYIDDVLYTMSNSKIKANELGTLSELDEIDLPASGSGGGYYYE